VRTALRAAGRAGAWLGLFAALVLGALTLAPLAFGWSPLVVRSGSMGRAVPVGSLVVVRPVTGDAVAPGEPIVVRRGGTAVLHRVVALATKDGRRFAQLKGDANAAADPGLDPLDGPLAVPVVVVPWAGYAVAALSSLAAPLLATLAGALALRLIWAGGTSPRDRDRSVSGSPS
jgi:signal peptidase I